jgi:aspartate racemase
MPCNSAHIYFGRLAAAIGVPLLSMVDEALRALPLTSKTIALLATRPTVESRLYQAAIERAGRVVIAGEAWQQRVDQLILAIKFSGDRVALDAQWRQLVADLASAGADTLLLACTDLNVVGTIVNTRIALLDATQCLAQAAVRTWRNLT